MRRVRRGLALVLLAAAGCARTERLAFELGALAPAYGFVALLDADGRLTRTTGVFGYAGGRRAFGEPSLTLADGEETALLIGLDDAALRAVAPAFDAGRAEEIEVRRGAAACERGVLSADRTRLDTKLPEGAGVFAAKLGSDTTFGPATRMEYPAVDALVLSLPLAVERCRDTGGDELTPFGAAPRLLPAGTEIRGLARDRDFVNFRNVLRADDDHLLALSPGGVYAFTRGRAFEDAPGRYLLATDLPGTSSTTTFRRMALFGPRRTTPGAEMRVIALAGGPGLGIAVELAYAGDELRLVRTATRTRVALLDVLLDREGNLVLVGNGGLVRVQPPGGTVERAPARLGPPSSLGRIFETADPARPYLIAASDGRVFIGDARSGRFRFETTQLPQLDDKVIHARGLGAVGTGDAFEPWASGSDGRIYRRRPGDDWRRVELDLPARYALCGTTPDACGRSGLSAGTDDLAVDPRSGPAEARVLVVPDRCTAMLSIRSSDACVSVYTERGLLAQPASNLTGELNAVEISERWITVAGDHGIVYESRR